MHNKYNLPDSFIKNIAIKLPENYKLTNNPFESDEENNQEYLGREDLKKKFLGYLNSSLKGVYLVTGYRGMGKTSFVNHVIKKHMEKEKEKEVVPIRLTLAQTNPKEFDVLRQIVSSIHNEYITSKSSIKFNFNFWLKFILILFSFITFFKYFIRISGRYFETTIYYFDIKSEYLLLFLFLSLSTLLFLEKFFFIEDVTEIKIKNLLDRCHSFVNDEKSKENNFGMFSGIVGNGIGEKNLSKKTKQYPIADSKIIEYELIDILKNIKNKRFIIIFDELDKIELNNQNWNLNEDLENFENRIKNGGGQNQLRNRKQAVLSIITGLKNFFTSANATFIFIAGREMFDASLADIADKQSPLGSIFTNVFHIESLLKERGADNNISSLSIEIENFLKYQLFSKNEINNGEVKLSYKELIERKLLTNEEDSKHVYFLLQAFITYLVYRSSGSPKKLIRAFQEFVVVKKIQSFKNKEHYITLNEDEKPIKKEKQDYSYYLAFKSNDQYRINFINSIYRPFIVEHGRGFKSFSENTVISIPYFFDHLFKFHPFAFSMSNLELIPDLLSNTKTPSHKNDLKQVINYLYQNHIRDTDIKLFDYKFYSKTANEISYISKLFEEEAAAFNFVLDESYPAKSILINKIKELRSIYSKFGISSEKQNPQIFSIANLNSNLGDLYFFDQEFDDAISSYSDSIRSISNLNVESINMRDFINLVRNKLKIGLCYEKINSFEDALSFYSDSAQDIKRFFLYYLKNSKYLNFDEKQEKIIPHENTFFFSSMNDLLQICIQSFLANLHIQEKMGIEGTTSSKAKVAFSDFYRIVEETAKHCGKNRMIIANSLLHYGKLLFYKNSSLVSIQNPDGHPNHYPITHQLKRNGFKDYFENSPQNSLRQPTTAFWLYLMALDEVMRTRSYFTKEIEENGLLYENKNKNKLILINDYLNNLIDLANNVEKNGQYSECFTGHHFKYFGNLLSSIGDCMLSMYDMKDKLEEKEDHKEEEEEEEEEEEVENTPPSFWRSVEFVKNCIEKIDTKSITSEDKNSNKFTLEQVFKCYYLAAKFYEKYGRKSSAIYEYRKILSIVLVVLPTFEQNESTNTSTKKTKEDKKKESEDLLNLLKEKIIKKMKEQIKSNSIHSQKHMINKASEVLKNQTVKYSIAIGSDIKEIDLLYENISLKLINKSDKYNAIMGSCHSYTSQYLRILELDYSSRYLNKEIKKTIREKNLTTENEKNIFYQSLIDFLYNKISIMRILKIYESDYLFGPSYNAYVHYSTAKLLCEKINDKMTIKEFIKANPDFEIKLSNLLGAKSYIIFDEEYHYGMAKDYYQKAIQLHTAGKEYKKQIQDLIYLEDDFNDNAYHFGASLERYLMVNDFFKLKINEIDKKTFT